MKKAEPIDLEQPMPRPVDVAVAELTTTLGCLAAAEFHLQTAITK